jgi:hypothetical protein
VPPPKSLFQLRPKRANKQMNKIATAATTLPPITIVCSIGSLDQVDEPVTNHEPRSVKTQIDGAG